MKGFLYCFILFPIVLSAQTNENDSLKFKADLALTGFWQAGNVETLIFRAKSDLAFKPWRKLTFRSKNSYVYQEFGKQKADEDILSLNFLFINPEKKIYPLLLSFVSTNFRREIDLRYLVGAGIAFELIEHEKDWLKFSISSEYEQTNFASTTFNLSEYNGMESINTFRSTLWVNGKYHLFKNKMIITHESYIQPSIEKQNNYRWQADFGLELPIWKHLNFKINYLHTFESIVIENQKREDRFLTFGFKIKSYE